MCLENYEIDAIEPDCYGGNCLVPPLSKTGARVLEMRGLLSGLHDLVDSGTVFRVMGGVSKAELQLLAAVEAEINRTEKED